MITTHTNTIILVDMDGVLCDFNQSLLRNAHEKLGAPLLTNKDCTTFYTEEMFGSQFKTLVHGAVLIDDKPEITGSVVPTWKHVYFDQPYNSIYDKPRITTWSSWKEELLPLLEG